MLRREPSHFIAVSSAVLIGLVLCFSSASAKPELSSKQARKLIATMPGFNLKTEAVHVSEVRSIDAATAQATAEIAMPFRFEKDDKGNWSVAEFRTGQEQWESVKLLAQGNQGESECSGERRSQLTNRRARCLLSELLAVQLPSDAIRIKDISTLSLPLSSKGSALVDALVTADFQFSKQQNGAWRVNGVRTGAHNWVDPQTLLDAVTEHKDQTARADMETLARALADFYKQRGSYVETKNHAVLVNFLSPKYLSRIIRLDPWRRPYVYEGTRDHFTLRSLGPDGKENTADDIVVSAPSVH
jgi:hypothetical protein